MKILDKILNENANNFMGNIFNKIKISLNPENINRLNKKMTNEFKFLEEDIGYFKAINKIKAKYNLSVQYLLNEFSKGDLSDTIDKMNNNDNQIIDFILNYKRIIGKLKTI